jgi:hypothetical protein
MTGRHVEPVKAGIALLGVSGSGQDRELMLTLGRHEDFTLFCAAAIRSCQPEPDRVLWSLAQVGRRLGPDLRGGAAAGHRR